MKSHARVVVIGGGCVGCGVLYGLARAGITDTLLIERNGLASGSSRLGGGFIPTYVRADTSSRIINRSIDIYRGLEAETGLSVGWHNCGQMRIARQRGRWDEYLSYMDSAPTIGADARLITPEEVMELCPLYESPEGMFGALLHPGDGYVGPSDVTMALARGARLLGAEIAENTGMTGYRRGRDGNWRVETTQGPVTCEHLVLATGNYARQVSEMAGLDLPTMPVVVQYWFTTPSAPVMRRKTEGRPEIPITRDEHFLGYLREEGDGLMFGTYERPDDLQLFGVDGISDTFDGGPLPADFDANAWGFERAAEVIPTFADLGIKSNVRGPMQMTADGLPLIGPAWGVDNLWLAEGVPGGILWGGGAGEALASWIANGEPDRDMTELDPRRFGANANKDWIRLKAVEIWGAHSDLILPGQDFPAARPQATSPIWQAQTEAGATWTAASGWETALAFPGAITETNPDLAYRPTAPDPALVAEVQALQHGAGLADLAGTAELSLQGPGATKALSELLARPLPPLGGATTGTILSRPGGVLARLTVLHLGVDLFRLIAPAATARLAADVLRRALAPMSLRDHTQGLARFHLAGPSAVKILAEAGAIIPAVGQIGQSSIGLTPKVRVTRLAENSFDLTCALPYQRALHFALTNAGTAHGLRPVGLNALNAQRILAGSPAWGVDLHAHTPITQDARQRLVLMQIGPGEGAPLGLETILQEGLPVGRTTSATWVEAAPTAIGWLDRDAPSQGLTISVLGNGRPITIVKDWIEVL